MSTKKEFLEMLLKKYNKKYIRVVENFDNFPGSISNGEIRIVFDIDVVNKDTLLLQDIINKDNISLYYEFMSDEDIEKCSDLLNNTLLDRFRLIRQKIKFKDKAFTPLKDYDMDIALKSNNYIYISFFGIKDTLRPINEYIAEIKESEAYKRYMAKKS